MDMRTFGRFVLMLGLVVFAGGGFYYLSNTDRKVESRPQDKTLLGSIDAMGRSLEVGMENMQRKSKREDAVVWLGIGGVVSFLGIGMVMSANK